MEITLFSFTINLADVLLTFTSCDSKEDEDKDHPKGIFSISFSLVSMFLGIHLSSVE